MRSPSLVSRMWSITSVDRDDLADGGAEHFARTVRAIREQCPSTTIEILTPDFLRKDGALELVVAAKPDVFNHNLETVPSRYLSVRPGARYFHSVRLLQRVKEIDPTIFTKSGIMVGLGEERHEVLQVMDDLRSADVDFLTIGQYLQPTRKHHAVARYIPPDEFAAYEKVAYTKGFLMVSASPLTRSSHHAGEDFAKLQGGAGGRLALDHATRPRPRLVRLGQIDLCPQARRDHRPACGPSRSAVLGAGLGPGAEARLSGAAASGARPGPLDHRRQQFIDARLAPAARRPDHPVGSLTPRVPRAGRMQDRDVLRTGQARHGAGLSGKGSTGNS